jgi:HEAT repeat protein
MPRKFATVLLVVFACCAGAQSVKVMNSDSSLRSQLAQLIGARDAEQAKALARRMNPGDVGVVLQEMAGTPRTPVQLLVLDIASGIPSEGACRAVLGRLQDSNLTIRAVANSLIGSCNQRTVVPDLLHAMDESQDSLVQAAIARQIGISGDATVIPELQARYTKTRDQSLRDNLTAAMARLGDENSRKSVIRRLTDPDLDTRIRTLHEIEYIGDPRLARFFRPVLEDRRDAIAISPPHDPRVMARLCDVAAGSMTALGLPLPYRALPLRRLSEAEIQQALAVVRSLETAQ